MIVVVVVVIIISCRGKERFQWGKRDSVEKKIFFETGMAEREKEKK